MHLSVSMYNTRTVRITFQEDEIVVIFSHDIAIKSNSFVVAVLNTCRK